ncbi:hypothetical protein ACIPDW_34820, partial [Streptomyces sp. NPDC087290]|uniref:hypothetical protein n=1 Tax=Streptomyces sp. NPDC087290 TaxID=3365776 RepID=UPI00380E74DC
MIDANVRSAIVLSVGVLGRTGWSEIPSRKLVEENVSGDGVVCVLQFFVAERLGEAAPGGCLYVLRQGVTVCRSRRLLSTPATIPARRG